MAGVVQEVVVLVVRERPEGWSVESTGFHVPNMVSCGIFSGIHRTPLNRAYLFPSTLDQLPDLEEAQNRFPGRDPIVIE